MDLIPLTQAYSEVLDIIIIVSERTLAPTHRHWVGWGTIDGQALTFLHLASVCVLEGIGH